jgi:hypothetical protein
MKRLLSPVASFALIASGTALGGAGTDLVLPAVPSLPAALGGTPAEAQYVLAAFVAGVGLGLVLFGELGARLDPRKTLAASLGLYALFSLASALAPTLATLIVLRFAQGAVAAAPAVFAPGFIRALFAPERATSWDLASPCLRHASGPRLSAHFSISRIPVEVTHDQARLMSHAGDEVEPHATRAPANVVVADRPGGAVCAGMLAKSEIQGYLPRIPRGFLTEGGCCALSAVFAKKSASIQLPHSSQRHDQRRFETRLSAVDVARRGAIRPHFTLLRA